jgi:glycosyltransferase involved in cell wall biosynthesis
VHVIANAADPLPTGAPGTNLSPPSEDYILTVGRVTAQKNYRLLIEAAQLLRDRSVRISIIGGADLSDEDARLRSLVVQSGCDNVAFVGVLDRARVLERLGAAALYVNCSVHEGMSNSVLEAIQQGTPILLSDIEANRDLGLPEAFYFDPTSPADLARRIESALGHPSDFVVDPERFRSWDEVVERYRHYMNLPG